MSRRAFISSAVLHGVVLSLMALDFSFAKFDNTPLPPAILMVDLKKVTISEKTNLPPQVKEKPKKESPKKITPIPPPKPVPKTQSTKVVKKEPTPPKPAPVPPIKNAAPVIEPPKKPELEKKKPEPKKEEKAPPPPPKPDPQPEPPQQPTPDDLLKSLLTSVDQVKKAPPAPTQTPEPEALHLNHGIEGGTEGTLSQVLSLSERDLIAGQLSKCWNLDAGKKDIENIIIEIRAQINKDGSVREVEIVNKKLNAVHQSVAESAKRAVLVCDKKGDESPFRILADKYPNHYGDWKMMTLRFNPLTGGVK